MMPFSLSRPVHISAVVDSKDRDLASLIVDPIEDPIGATTSAEDARQFVAQLSADAVRFI